MVDLGEENSNGVNERGPETARDEFDFGFHRVYEKGTRTYEETTNRDFLNYRRNLI